MVFLGFLCMGFVLGLGVALVVAWRLLRGSAPAVVCRVGLATLGELGALCADPRTRAALDRSSIVLFLAFGAGEKTAGESHIHARVRILDAVEVIHQLRDGVGFGELLSVAARDDLRLALADALTGHDIALFCGHERWISRDDDGERLVYSLRCACGTKAISWPGDPSGVERVAHALGWEVTAARALCPTCRQIRDDVTMERSS